jgi:hypothetical protein
MQQNPLTKPKLNAKQLEKTLKFFVYDIMIVVGIPTAAEIATSLYG